MQHVVVESSHLVGILPLAWLVVLALVGQDRSARVWWIATGYGVSYLADSVAHSHPALADLVGNTYPIMQAALIAGALVSPKESAFVLGTFVWAGLLSLVWASNVDVLLRTVAWGTVAGLTLLRPIERKLGLALVVTFGAGLLAWYWYAANPSWTSYGVYQSERAIGTALFCWAVL
jgi:hypothetical protein